MLALPPAMQAANTKTTQQQVSGTMNVTDDVDLRITSATPFADDAVLNIENTEHAVVILDSVKPSAAIRLLAAHVQINGEKAVNNTNCQVKLYNRGSIILPYGNSVKALTVFSEPNFGGTSADNFGTGNDGGFMNTLTEAQLNNQIRSFRLKRGYMVTFSTQARGRGYSRCFIAASEDLEVSELPIVLDQKISSYRLFKWYDTGKQQLAAAGGDKAACSALNVTSTYTWSAGSDMLPDVECVSHHIYEDWPSAAACGNVNYTCHMKTNNEPRNSSDDHPQDLTTILNNWENLMATGMRLCSPSSWDGSDYWNGTGFLKEFFDSIDARGWRCDIVDMHCYWPESNFGNLQNWVNAVHRPVWISEWVWGASWNSNGAFANGITEAQNAAALKRICTNLNSMAYVERYYYWNGERDPSKIYKNGSLTAAGQYYASINSGVGYNGRYDFIPKNPRQYPPSDFKAQTEGDKVAFSWRDRNGEYNQLVQIERKPKGGQWEPFMDVKSKNDAGGSMLISTEGHVEGTQYRLHMIDLNGNEYYTNDDIEPGDAVETTDGRTLYAGGNLLVNGDFNLGTYDWTTGKDNAPGQPYFEVVPIGGYRGGSYLQAYGNGAMNTDQSIKKVVALEAGKDYYFRAATRNGGTNQRFSLTTNGSEESKVVATLKSSDQWQLQGATFNSENYEQGLISFRQLGAKAQIDKVELRQLFETREEAIGNAEAIAQAQADIIAQFETAALQQRQDSIAKVEAALKAIDDALTLDKLMLEEATVQPKSPDFKAVTGWTTKAGTYTGGDQRLNTVREKTCWNAWWANINASAGKSRTMEIKQTVSDLPEGIYLLECKATTQHFCLSDQHGYLVSGQDTVSTPALTADYFDLPVDNIWQTLTTTPIYIEEGGSATLGFVGSKQGAIDNAWHSFGDASSTGDKREGWWCATDFRLLYQPIYTRTEGETPWGTICLPQAFNIPASMTLYKIAGITADSTQVCLEEVTETAAGIPYIYYAESPTLRFYQWGESKNTGLTGDNNLRGFQKMVTTKAPVDSYVLHEGKWYVVSERPKIESYTAIIRKLDGMTVLDSWQGATMPLVHQPWEVVNGIANIKAAPKADGKAYDLGGRQTNSKHGLRIVNGRKVVK